MPCCTNNANSWDITYIMYVKVRLITLIMSIRGARDIAPRVGRVNIHLEVLLWIV